MTNFQDQKAAAKDKIKASGASVVKLTKAVTVSLGRPKPTGSVQPITNQHTLVMEQPSAPQASDAAGQEV
ncbi:MAG: hypothetical protein COB79_05165, partial [Zetaproteobacteria bacterium]